MKRRQWPDLLYLAIVFSLAAGAAFLGVQRVTAEDAAAAAHLESLNGSDPFAGISRNVSVSTYDESMYQREPKQIMRASGGTVDLVATHRHLPGFDADIVLIGDSFTWGEAVPLTGTYPYHFAAAFSERTNETITAVNWGMGGAGARDYLYIFNKSVELYSPELVIVALAPDEDSEALSFRIRDILHTRARRYLEQQGEPLGPDTANNTQLRRVLEDFASQFRDRHGNRTVSEWYLDPIASQSTEGCPRVVFYAYWPVERDDWSYWKRWAVSRGVPIRFAPSQLEAAKYHRSRSDQHYTPEGYRLLANHLARTVSPDLLDAC